MESGGGEEPITAGLLMMNESMVNGTTLPAEAPAWIYILDTVQLAATVVGFVTNIGTFITLTVNGEDFSDIIRMLFKCQSTLDALVCLSAALLFGLQPMWKVGNDIFDTFICQLWHGQYAYWVTVSMSVHNLVILAVERYMCVCHPLKYQAISKKTFRNIIIAVICIDLIWVSPGCIQTRFRDGQCYSELLWPSAAMANFMFSFSVVAFFAAYAIPTCLFVILYGMVIFSFRKRAKENLGASGTASVITKATSELTKTAIVVTLVFIVALGFDLIYYFLAHLGVVPYVFNSPIQKIAVLFSVVNSVANPFIYASFMPLYRKSVKQTLSCKKA